MNPHHVRQQLFHITNALNDKGVQLSYVDKQCYVHKEDELAYNTNVSDQKDFSKPTGF